MLFVRQGLFLEKYFGLGIINAIGESLLQHYNICILLNSNDEFISYVKDIGKEIDECFSSLAIIQEVITELRSNRPNTNKINARPSKKTIVPRMVLRTT